VSLYYTMGGCQTVRAIGKGKGWQAGFEMSLGHHTLSIPLKTYTNAVTYTALNVVMAGTS